MNLLILGGTTFLGKELLTQALSQNHQVTLISLDAPEEQEKINWLKVDRSDLKKLTEVLVDKEFDAIIDNIAFTAEDVKILLSAINGRAIRYVLTSTVDIYRNQKMKKVNEIIDNNLEIEDITGNNSYKRYSINKRNAEIALRNDHTIKEKVILRPCNVLGPYDNVKQHGVPRSLIWPSKIVDSQPLILPLNEYLVYSLVDVKDVAKAQLLVAEHPDAVNQVFNVVGDTLWTTEKFIQKLCYYYGSDSKVITRVTHQDLIKNGVLIDSNQYLPMSWGASPTHKYPLFDNSSLKNLGWKPTDERETLLSLLSHSQVLQDAKEKLQVIRDREINYAKTFAYNNYDHFIEGYCQSNLSSVAIGTYRGNSDSIVDDLYSKSIEEAVLNGINVIDTAINYRQMRSERVVGSVIKNLVNQNKINRSNIYVMTKGGFLGSAYRWEFHTENEVKISHSIRPSYISHVFETSYQNLGIKTIDMYFLHNPENSKEHMSEDDFYYTLLMSFIKLETEVFKGRLREYGIATWDGLTTHPDNPRYLDFERILSIAEMAGGKNHNFKAIELPLNISRHEAVTNLNQSCQGTKKSAIDVAKLNNLKIFTSASCLYGNDNNLIHSYYNFDTLSKAAQKSLLFIKSIPGVTSAIAGMKQIPHVHEAIEVNNAEALTPEQITYTINQCIFRKIKK